MTTTSVIPDLSPTERDALALAIQRGPTRIPATAVRGRLALYQLISETPQGWIVTESGKNALHRARKRLLASSIAPERPRSAVNGKRLPHGRSSPW